MGKHALGVARSAVSGLATTAGILALSLLTTVSSAAQLATNTVLAMGGTQNGNALNPPIKQELGGDPWYPAPDTDPFRSAGTFGHGYLDTVNNHASPYFGWDFVPVTWPADVLAYETSQQQGLHNFSGALSAALAGAGSTGSVVAVGYSSSANVMVREMRTLQSQAGGAPATDRLQFLLVGNPNRPNGGILQRFAGLYVPLLDIPLDGSTPLDTPYATTDISWEYDAASDFPTYPLNLLAVANAVLAGSFVHGNYFAADLTGPRAFPDTTIGNITYITLKTPHLPLLMPLYEIGFPTALLDLVEPALTVMVDWGYDRSAGPGTPATAGLLPRLDPLTAATDLVDAIGQGVRNVVADLAPAAVRSVAATPRSRAGGPRGRGDKADGYRAKTPQLRHSVLTESSAPKS